MLRKLNNCVPRSTLTTIYKSFVRRHLDYGDIMFDKAYNNSFRQRLESLQNRRWFRKPHALLKIVPKFFI